MYCLLAQLCRAFVLFIRVGHIRGCLRLKWQDNTRVLGCFHRDPKA
jgi:hypothetical protein